ncbi:ATP-binding protein [Piscinibacter sp.]|uniref:ATP-binding protein n=1 Tax=Piscinibacter sp. TaxID=1903157 RepID=UPI0039E2B0EA
MTGGTAAPAPSGPDRHGLLARRVRWLLLGVTLPLFAVVLALAALQYHDQREQVLQDLATASGSYAISLDAVAKLAHDHVLQMQAWSEGYFTHPPGFASGLRRHFTPRLDHGQPDGYTLDAVPEDQRAAMGQLLWLGEDPRVAGSGRVALDHGLDFFGLVRLTHDLTPYFRWSYFFPASRDYLSIYPWASSTDMVNGMNYGSVRAGMPRWFGYEVFTAGTPQRNPKREVYWTAPYLDGAGTGAMVSVGAPVYRGEQFEGIVATDLKLAMLESLVRRFRHDVGRLWVLDARQRVLADSGGAQDNALHRFDEVRPAGLHAAALETAHASPGAPVEAGGHTVVVHDMPHAPWTLVYGISEGEIGRLLLPRFIPYGVILAILALNFFVALYLLRRELIHPALALARYIQQVAEEPGTAAPRLPALWQPLAGVVSRALDAHRRATLQLQHSEAFKSAIVENAMLAVVTTDEQARIVEFNAAAEAIFQRTREAVLRQDMVALLIAPAEREACRDGLRRLLAPGAAGGHDRRELSGVRADGSEVALEMSVSSALVGDTCYFTAFFSDLTSRKAAERELASQRETLRQSEKLSAMGALLAGVAHELNNPLAILMGRSALLERKAADPAVKADALKIHAAADRCGRIVRTFLAMARQRPAQRRRVQLADVVGGALDLVGYNLRSGGIEVVQRLDEPLPALEVDADQIGQVVVNLLVNAQQALADQPEPRRVTVTAHAQGEGVVLRLQDNGPGVAASIRDRIFDPFFTTKPEGAGTGVGLSVSRAIVREHGGELALVDSAAGAAFELYLPLRGPHPLPADGAAPVAEAGGRGGHALVIDDEDEVAQLLCDVLRSAGCTATSVASGREALAWLDRNACSVILCDIRMPDMDGPAFWRALQARHPQMLRHLAFVTGDTLSASVAPFLRETGLPSLDKPFTPDEVLELVAQIERVEG